MNCSRNTLTYSLCTLVLETSSACPMCKLLRWPVDIDTHMHCQKVRMVCVHNTSTGIFIYLQFSFALTVQVIFLCVGGHVFSWGQNQFGQLGLGMHGSSISTPQLMQSLQGIPFAQLSAGGAHSFAITLSGAVFGWGRNKFGQLGLNDTNGGLPIP